jgi:mycothiol synthase
MNDVTIRPLRPEDVPAAVELLAQANASDDRHRLRNRLTSEDHFAIVAERAGTIIGAGKATTEPAFPGTVSALVAVAEDERGRGLGARLAEPVVERLGTTVAARAATCTLRDDRPSGRRFAERYGFAETNHSVGWRFELIGRTEELAARAAELTDKAGIRVRRLDEVTELPLLMDVAQRSMVGLPMPFGEEQGFDIEQVEGLIPDHAVILVGETAAGVVGGLTVASPQAGTDEWYTNFTGVDANLRGRGVALALKTVALSIAAVAGASAMTTHNDDVNQPIQRLNKALGMTRSVGYWGLTRPLSGG